ncbi:MAG: SH3 domain-containing protein [Methylotenera sp.]|jgi:SH3-like domain-containing protein|nr:SH3 domain-containing protein [Methylotenera sp.]
MSQFSKIFVLLSLVLMPITASALEFKSVSVPKAVLYDAPSSSAKKILLLSQYYPVEIIVNLGDWLKVRDAEGSISWVETKQLSDKRTVMITVNQAEIRQAADAGASLVATLEKGVLLEVVDIKPNNGWLKVRHRDGATGFVLISSTWGFN